MKRWNRAHHQVNQPKLQARSLSHQLQVAHLSGQRLQFNFAPATTDSTEQVTSTTTREWVVVLFISSRVEPPNTARVIVLVQLLAHFAREVRLGHVAPQWSLFDSIAHSSTEAFECAQEPRRVAYPARSLALCIHHQVNTVPSWCPSEQVLSHLLA